MYHCVLAELLHSINSIHLEKSGAKTAPPWSRSCFGKRCHFFPSYTTQNLSIYTPPQKKRNFPQCVSFETECTGSLGSSIPLRQSGIDSVHELHTWLRMLFYELFMNLTICNICDEKQYMAQLL